MKIAIVGASGLVGREILKIIHEKGLDKNNQLALFASSKSSGKDIIIGKKSYKIKELKIENLEDCYDYVLFSAGGEISKIWAKEFIKRNAVVIDNSNAFRRDDEVPLIVPEINFNAISKKSKIIANPNCSTIGASLPLNIMSKKYKIKRVIISTYQAVSGAGQKGLSDLENSTCEKFNYQIRNNVIPHIDKPLKNGYTLEEDKMEFELKKILNNKELKVSSTCVRVPITNCHSESLYVEFDQKPNLIDIINLFEGAEGITLHNDLHNFIYPMPIDANSKDDVLVGRIRNDTANENAVSLFISFDNLRKGAALNAVQIMEKLINNKKHQKIN